MNKLKRIIAVFVVCLMLLPAGLTAFCDDSQEVDAGAQNIEAADTGASETEAVDSETENTEAENIEAGDSGASDGDGAQYTDVMDVLLPSDISFDIVIVRTRKTGIVASEEFKIINRGENDVAVKISSACLKISDETNFAVSDNADLPEEGNSIYVEMICSSDGSTEALPLTNTPDGTEYTYYLESGGEGTFWLEGVVNEFGEASWSDVSVTVSICFSMEDEGEVTEASRADRSAEAEEAATTDAAPETEATHEAEAVGTEEAPGVSGIAEVEGTSEAREASGTETAANESADAETAESEKPSPKEELPETPKAPEV